MDGNGINGTFSSAKNAWLNEAVDSLGESIYIALRIYSHQKNSPQFSRFFCNSFSLLEQQMKNKRVTIAQMADEKKTGVEEFL